jgi:U3 small nucleolar RNA-associated protein 4
MVIEPEITVTVGETNRVGSPEETSSLSSDNDSNIDKNDGESSENEEEYVGEKRVAIACDDGSVRLFTVKDGESLTYKKSFPRIEGILLITLE